MRKSILIIGASLMTFSAMAQKKEIRNANRAFDSGDYSTALTELNSAESSINDAKDPVKAEFYILKSKTIYASSSNDIEKIREAISNLKEANKYASSSKIKDEITSVSQGISEKLVNDAIEDQNASHGERAADKLMEAYKLNEADTVYLYYAASNYHNAGQYDKALKGYKDLLDMGYTGKRTQYYAVNNETGEKELFGEDKNQRDLMLKSNTYSTPTDEKTEDVTPQILQYMAYIYIQNEDFENAVKVVDDALKVNPENTDLLRAKADVIYQLGDKEEYKNIMKQIVSKDPNNPELLFNLGVSSAEIGEEDEALDYYNQTIKIDPNHYAANLNAAVLILNKDENIVEEMNNLGMTAEDNKKYDQLQEKRKELMNQAIPYLENAIKIDDSDVEVMRTLANVYMQVGEDEKSDALIEKINE